MAPKSGSALKVDLSSLPPAVQEAVGPELAASIARSMRLTKKPLVIGRLGPGIWGLVLPDAALERQIGTLIRKG